MGHHRPDRRSYPRAQFQSPVEVVCGEEYLPCCPCIDISEGGLRLLAYLPPTFQVKLLVPVAHRNAMEIALVKGEVAWSRPDATGIRFVSLPATTEALIRDYVLARRVEPDRGEVAVA